MREAIGEEDTNPVEHDDGEHTWLRQQFGVERAHRSFPSLRLGNLCCEMRRYLGRPIAEYLREQASLTESLNVKSGLPRLFHRAGHSGEVLQLRESISTIKRIPCSVESIVDACCLSSHIDGRGSIQGDDVSPRRLLSPED